MGLYGSQLLYDHHHSPLSPGEEKRPATTTMIATLSCMIYTHSLSHTFSPTCQEHFSIYTHSS